jgi:hypothetical protein
LIKRILQISPTPPPPPGTPSLSLLLTHKLLLLALVLSPPLLLCRLPRNERKTLCHLSNLLFIHVLPPPSTFPAPILSLSLLKVKFEVHHQKGKGRERKVRKRKNGLLLQLGRKEDFWAKERRGEGRKWMRRKGRKKGEESLSFI